MIISRTPLRISFFGGGTDYPAWFKNHEGAVLATTIDKYIYISCRYLPPFFEHKSRIVWSHIELVKNNFEIKHPSVRECLKFMKIRTGMEIHYDADLPSKSGLGSSTVHNEFHSETKKCSFCAEEINVDAIKCKHCGSNLADKKAASAPVKNTGESLGILMLLIPVVAAILILFFVGSASMIGNPHNILTLIVFSTVAIWTAG